MAEKDRCVLCEVVGGELPSRKVYEDTSFLAILDVNPCAEGRCLVVPKTHTARFNEMGDDELAHLFRVVKIVARKIKKAFNLESICVFIRGRRISHLCVAVFPPMQGDSPSDFPQSMFEGTEVDLENVAARLTAIKGNRCSYSL
ncbi:HIT domain-containing protein [Candidatus Bathyarchaeota archaeon]|nr:HIT domain-containing protein [Candidatus Bathyarchaeota archaeon]